MKISFLKLPFVPPVVLEKLVFSLAVWIVVFPGSFIQDIAIVFYHFPLPISLDIFLFYRPSFINIVLQSVFYPEIGRIYFFIARRE